VFILSDLFLLVIRCTDGDTQLISLDPINYPVPTSLRKLERLPSKDFDGGGALLKPGNYDVHVVCGCICLYGIIVLRLCNV
jgi:hypothetical protein